MQTLYCGERAPPPPEAPAPGAWRNLVDASDDQLRRLRDIVKRRYPQFVPADNLTAFRAAFIFVQSCGRLEQPDRRYFASHFGELAEQYARAVYAPVQDVAALTFAAVLAAGDVPFCLQSSGVSAAIGLCEHGGRRAGKALMTNQFGNQVLVDVTPAWKEILAGTRSLREPDAPPTLVPTRPVTINFVRNWSGEQLPAWTK